MFHGHGYHQVSKADLKEILGIPGSGNSVKGSNFLGVGSSRSMRKSEIIFGPISLNSNLKKAQDVIKDQMTPEQKSAFLAAIMIYTVGTFLDPSDRNTTEVEESVLLTISGKYMIDSYDWQGYVLAKLSQTAAKVRGQLHSGCPVARSTWLAAPTFFWQVDKF